MIIIKASYLAAGTSPTPAIIYHTTIIKFDCITLSSRKKTLIPPKCYPTTLFSLQLGLDEFNMNIIYHEYMIHVYHEYHGYNISYEYQYPGLNILSMNITNRRGDKGHSCQSGPKPMLIVLDSMPRMSMSIAQSVQGIKESSLLAPPTEHGV